MYYKTELYVQKVPVNDSLTFIIQYSYAEHFHDTFTYL